MNIELLHNKIVILDGSSKSYLLQLLSKKLINVKIITLDELLKGYLFDYDEKTLYYICNKYSVCIDVAKRYLNSLYSIEKDNNNSKLHFLYELKQDLILNNLLIFNELLPKYLVNKDIVLYNLNYISKKYQKIIDQISLVNRITYIQDQHVDSKKTIIECLTKEDEISLVATKIASLLLKGISINKIKIANLPVNYQLCTTNIFKEFNIPLNLNSSDKVYGTKIIKEFINNYNSNIEKTINIISCLIKTPKDEKIFKKIINVVNKYNWIEDYLKVKEFIINDLAKLTIPHKRYQNAVELIDLKGYVPNNDDYIYIVNFNDGSIPKEYKDEDYLTDKEKELIGESTSLKLNEFETNNILNKIKSINNLVITYSKNIGNEESYISSLYDEYLMIKEPYKIDFNYSNDFNKSRLIASLDNYNKYGVKDEILNTLYNNYKDIPYLSYDHKYNIINANIDKLELSYSSMDNYYKCAFKFYLKNILKIDKEDETFAIHIGNIFHHILMHFYENDFNPDKLWDAELSKIDGELKSSEKHFLKRLKEDLLIIIDILKDQYSYTNLKSVLLEKRISIPLSDRVSFKGFVDKIMYEQKDDKTIASVIDYKTGTPNINIDNIVYGLDMQLPVYVFLIKNSDLFNNIVIGGFYLQHILKNTNDMEEKIKSLKLYGYSNSDINILSEVDSSYDDSRVIQSMKMTQNGFSRYAKVLDNNQIETISNIVKEKIIEASNDILSNNFIINPKEINEENVACKYCPYKDICFMDNKDVITLEPKNLFGGDENGVD